MRLDEELQAATLCCERQSLRGSRTRVYPVRCHRTNVGRNLCGALAPPLLPSPSLLSIRIGCKNQSNSTFWSVKKKSAQKKRIRAAEVDHARRHRFANTIS